MTNYTCPRCGGATEQLNDNKYKCTYCANVFKDTDREIVESVREIIYDQQDYTIGNLVYRLREELSRDITDSQTIVDIAEEILSYEPKHFLARFAKVTNSGSDRDVLKFLTDIDTDKYYGLVGLTVDFLLKTPKRSWLVAINNIIDVYKNKEPKKYSDYANLIARQSQEIDKGVYNLDLTRDVFVAYSSKDMPKVIELVDKLERQKISCFVAARNLHHGVGAKQNYETDIKKAIDNCRIFVLVSSVNSRDGDCDVIKLELPYARSQDKAAFPPEYKNEYYQKVPYIYKKPRIEYFVNDYVGNAYEEIVKEFYAGLNWCYKPEDVIKKAVSIKTYGWADQVGEATKSANSNVDQGSNNTKESDQTATDRDNVEKSSTDQKKTDQTSADHDNVDKAANSQKKVEQTTTKETQTKQTTTAQKEVVIKTTNKQTTTTSESSVKTTSKRVQNDSRPVEASNLDIEKHDSRPVEASNLDIEQRKTQELQEKVRQAEEEEARDEARRQEEAKARAEKERQEAERKKREADRQAEEERKRLEEQKIIQEEKQKQAELQKQLEQKEKQKQIRAWEYLENAGLLKRKDDYVYFGSYPQTEVNDETIINSLNELAGTLPSADNPQKWTSYGYYMSGAVKDYTWYIDLHLDDNLYRGVYFSTYRPNDTESNGLKYVTEKVKDKKILFIQTYKEEEVEKIDSNQYDNGYRKNTVYWFRFDPIKWRILSDRAGEVLILAEDSLDSQEYYHTASSSAFDFDHNGGKGYSNNYELSYIRKWLNETFYNTAFNDEQKQLILKTKVDNGARSTNPDNNAKKWNDGKNKYASADTMDRVFLLSEQEATKSEYGFDKDPWAWDTARKKNNTDYARCQGAWTSTDSYKEVLCCWWLRSPCYINSDYARYVNCSSSAGSYFSDWVDYTGNGVVPALKIKLS